ncbi:Fatty acid hydroxylase family (carotene hydroxylase/sterol desaturase) [hydrothermal vent metagenome]|uniref:Fatty acid hydroxylase family (Carotene hydroxylase/sterol desaturase) n=1 Tax=hydrothermal vent metagenome TaxID=652676 RepID=A0A3B0XQ48_9ZZZZ
MSPEPYPLLAWISQHENIIRPSFFFSMLAIIGLWEMLAPRRALKVSKLLRWSNNLGLVFFNAFLLRLIFPAGAVGMAHFAQQQGWGLLNYVDVHPLLAISASVIAMDFIIYLQHVMVHAVPALWRLHRVHHADLDYDVTTGARFHPVEIILSMIIKFATIIVLGAPLVAVIIFEVVLNAMAMFNHGNIGLPPRLDRLLRYFIVTPDMHRVHHSIEDDETNSNFGFNLSCWDRFFGTWREQPRGGQLGMQIGIKGFNTADKTAWIHTMLIMPLTGTVNDYVINRREWPDTEKQTDVSHQEHP